MSKRQAPTNTRQAQTNAYQIANAQQVLNEQNQTTRMTRIQNQQERHMHKVTNERLPINTRATSTE